MIVLDDKLHKILISAPTLIRGGYSNDDVLFQPCLLGIPMSNTFQLGNKDHGLETHIMFVFRTGYTELELDEGRKYKPNLSYIGEIICIYLSIFYGKVFNNHGIIESFGSFRIPTSPLRYPINAQGYPFYSMEPRIDLKIPLNLTELKKIDILFQKVNKFIEQDEDNHNEPNSVLLASGRFYLRALQTFLADPEIAYLNLIQAGEILSDYISKIISKEEISSADIFDNEDLSTFKEIQKHCPNHVKIIDKLKSSSRMTKKFIVSIEKCLNNNYYSKSQSQYKRCEVTKEKIREILKVSYGLRSEFIHTGSFISAQIADPRNMQNELPVVVSGNFDPKKYQYSLTFSGLERIIRYCLLRFTHKYLFNLDDSLNDDN